MFKVWKQPLCAETLVGSGQTCTTMSARKRTQVGTTNRSSTLSPEDTGAASAPPDSKDQRRRASHAGRESSASSALKSRPASSTDDDLALSRNAVRASDLGQLPVSANQLCVGKVTSTYIRSICPRCTEVYLCAVYICTCILE